MKSNLKQNNWKGKSTLWLVLLIAFAYPIQASIPALLHLPSTPINASFRATYVILSVVLILSSFTFKTKLNAGQFWFLVFWILYSLRLVIDVSLRGYGFADKSTFFVYSMAFGNALLPIIAIILNGKLINVSTIFNKLFGVIFISNLLLIYIIIKQNGGISLSLFSGRMNILQQDTDETIINTITIGFYGNVMFIMSLYALMFIKSVKRSTSALFVFAALIGFFNLIVAGSRGPFLVMVFLVLYLLYVKYRVSVSKFGYVFKSIFVILTIYLCLAITGLSFRATEDFAIFSRLTSFEESIQQGKKEDRNLLYSEAWDQFLSNPVIGDKWVTTKDAYYPHNIYLEILMSMGIIGMFIFLLVNIEIIKRLHIITKRKMVLLLPLSLIVLANFLAAMTSGGIAFSVGLWVVIALFLSFSVKEANRQAPL